MLGVLADAGYRTASVDAQEHDLLVVFSDSISEATNHHDEYFVKTV